jgi:hypothetical protein
MPIGKAAKHVEEIMDACKLSISKDIFGLRERIATTNT